MPAECAAATVLVYQMGRRGRFLVRAEVLDEAPCAACNGTLRIRASGKAVPVTIACPWCRGAP